MIEEITNFLFNGNNEILAFAVMSVLCIAPLILIWRSTYVADQTPPNLQTSSREQAASGAGTRHVSTEISTPMPAAGTEPDDPPEVAQNVNEATSAASVNEAVQEVASTFLPEAVNEPPTTSQSSPLADNTAQPSTSQQPQSSSVPQLLPDHCYIRLKFLDETVQVVQAKPTDTVGEFRRRIFPSSLEDRYRLIFKGSVIRNTDATMRDCGVIPMAGADSSNEMPVIHCFLAPPAQTRRQGSNLSLNAQASMEDLSIGHFFLPIFGCIIGILWYLCINYTQLFTIPSLFGILALTSFFIVLVVNRFL